MKCLKLVSFFTLAWSVCIVARAEEFYIAQNATASAQSAGFFNNSANWSSPTKIAGKIGPGDIVHLVGTITTTLDVQASGTSGKVITILFDSGAKLSAPVWSAASGAIQVALKDYITIDGGATGTIGGYAGNPSLARGVIENTANGTGLANHVASKGIRAINANYFEVKNLVVQNIYVRTSTSDVYDNDSSCVSNQAANAEVITGYKVTNCVLHDAFRGIASDYGTGCSNYEFSYNTIYSINHGAGTGHRHDGATLTNLSFHHNWVYNWKAWNDPATNIYHHNGFFAFADPSNARLRNIAAYSNTFGPGYGNEYQTSGIYINSYVEDVRCYNNIFICNSGEYAANGLITLQSNLPTTFNILNNTFVGGSGAAIQVAGSGSGQAQNFNIKNNLGVGSGVGTFIACYNMTGVATNANNNLGYNYDPNLAYIYSYSGTGAFKTRAQWMALGFDTQGVSLDPLLDSNYKPKAGSPAINAGTSEFSGLFSDDVVKTPRPLSGAWDIGAYQVALSSTLLTPPSNARIVAQ